MIAPTIIDYATFISQAQENDINALALLSGGEEIATPDPIEAATYDATGQRLYDAGLLRRFRYARETRGGQVWFVFDSVLDPQAIVYVAQAAKERVMLSRNPEVPVPPAL